MTQTDLRGVHVFHDSVTFAGPFYPPAESIGNAAIKSDANNRIAAAKVIHRVDLNYGQADGADVVSVTKLLRICRGAGTLLGVEVRPTTAPTEFTTVKQATLVGPSWRKAPPWPECSQSPK